MTTVFDTVDLVLPQHWLVAFFNDDLSAYDEEEIEQIEHFTHYMQETYGTSIPLSYDLESDNFTAWHDARDFGVLACEVYTVTFPITKQKKA